MLKRTLTMIPLLFLAACEQEPSPAPKVEVNVTVHDPEESTQSRPKDERSTVVGDGQRFTRP